MRISDWSSDVCSSDLGQIRAGQRSVPGSRVQRLISLTSRSVNEPDPRRLSAACTAQDRKSVVQGKRGSVRVDLGGRRSIKKKNQTSNRSYKGTSEKIYTLRDEFGIKHQIYTNN